MDGHGGSGNRDSLGFHAKAGNLKGLALGSPDFKQAVVVRSDTGACSLDQDKGTRNRGSVFVLDYSLYRLLGKRLK